MSDGTTGDRIASALERIANAMEKDLPLLPSIEELAPLSLMTFDAQNDETPGRDTGERIEERIDLPIPGYAVYFASNPTSSEGFDLFLLGPGPQIRPLSSGGR